jgi:hypothetical protein
MSAFGGIADIHSAESNIRFKAQYDVAGPVLHRLAELLEQLAQGGTSERTYATDG